MITSTTNDKVKFLRSLHEAKGRRESGCFLVEGVRLVEEALLAGGRPSVALINGEQLAHTERGAALARMLRNQGALEASEKVLAAVATTVAPQGVVAAVPIPVAVGSQDLGPLALILDRLSDPGNVGTVLRSAEASGVTTVIAIRGTVDPFSPKVVRAGAGAHFHLSLVVDLSWDDARSLVADRPLLVTVADGGQAHFEVDWTKESALVVSSEAHGVSREAVERSDGSVTIPMVGRAESLNAAVAASVILFEALRQRLTNPR